MLEPKLRREATYPLLCLADHAQATCVSDTTESSSLSAAFRSAEPESSSSALPTDQYDLRSDSALASLHVASLRWATFGESVSRQEDNVRRRFSIASANAEPMFDMPEVKHPRLCQAVLEDVPDAPDLNPMGKPVDKLDRLANVGLDKATADGNRGRKKTGVKAWFAHCADEGFDPNMPLEPNSPLKQKLAAEWLAMRFVCALVSERGVSVDTAASYWSSAQGWHAKEHGIKIGGGLKFERLPAMLKGLRRLFGTMPKKVRRGLAPQALRRAMDLLLNPDNPEHANLRAAMAVSFQGLLRGEEFAIDNGKRWVSADRLNRADIKEINSERLVLMIHQCKNMRELKGKTVPLVIGAGGEFIDAVAEVMNMLKVDPAQGRDPSQVPLFRVPAHNTSITKETVHALVKNLMQAVGENPEHFGTHSMRIGGATALFARGADPTVIRTMGRWSSDIYQLYVRACFERCCEWTRKAGSAVVTDVVVEFDEVEAY